MKLPPDWMHACGDCADGLAQLAAGLVTVREDPWPYMKARELLCTHIASTHPDALPGPIEGCPDCAEWQATLRGPWAAGLAEALATHAAAHHAFHLLPPPDLSLPVPETEPTT